MPITISDIAEAVGKSAPTVSRALNNHPKISQKTRNYIQTVAKQMGYRPSFVGSSLKSGCTYLLSVIVPQITNPFYAKLINEIKHQVLPYNYDIMAYDFDLNQQLERKSLDRMLGRCCDGVITYLTSFSHTADIFNQMWNAKLPCVVIGPPPDDFGQVKFDAVDIDSSDAWLQTLTLLKSAGHRNIIFALGIMSDAMLGSITSQIKVCFEQVGLPFDPNRNIHYLSKSTGVTPLDGVNSGREIFGQCPDVTAIIAAYDFLAYGIMKVAFEHKKRIPEDLVLVGRDRTWISEFAPVSLPSIDQQLETAAESAVSIIFDRLNNQNWESPKRIKLQSKLIHQEWLDLSLGK